MNAVVVDKCRMCDQPAPLEEIQRNQGFCDHCEGLLVQSMLLD